LIINLDEPAFPRTMTFGDSNGPSIALDHMKLPCIFEGRTGKPETAAAFFGK
jgi:hypothetical protein